MSAVLHKVKFTGSKVSLAPSDSEISAESRKPKIFLLERRALLDVVQTLKFRLRSSDSEVQTPNDYE